MIQFTVGTEIARPPTEVFGYKRQFAGYCATLKQVLENAPTT